MLRVTFLTGEYPPMQGGIADHTAYLAQYLAPLGVEASILISRRWEETRAGGGEEAETRRDVSNSLSHRLTVSSPPRLTKSSPPPVIASLPNWGWHCWPGVVNFLQVHQPDVLHIQYQAAAFDLGGWVNWLPWFLKKRRVATSIVTTFHDLRVPYIFPKAGPFRWKSMLALARYSDAVVCTNREDLHTLQCALGMGQANSLTYQPPPRSLASSPHLALIPLGSNVEPRPPTDFDRVSWRKKYQADEQTMFLAYFGFLNESKGGEELIEALALLRRQGLDARLLLIGGDIGHADPTNVAYARRVQALIDRHGLVELVYRTGYTSLPEVSANLLASDVVVMPYRDGVSFRRTTLIAALRHGCPVVSTRPADSAAVSEIRPGENMLLVPPHDASALAQAITALGSDSLLRQKLALGAKQLGQLFEWDKIAGATTELYDRLKERPKE